MICLCFDAWEFNQFINGLQKKEGKKKQEMRKTLKYVELGASDMGVKKKQQQQKQMNLWGLRLEN